MSYDVSLLFGTILSHLNKCPRLTLVQLSRALQVSQQTVRSTIIASTGRGFTRLREEVLLSRTTHCFKTQPNLALKEVAFELGFTSPSSFTRAIGRVSGVCPEQLRDRVARDMATTDWRNRSTRKSHSKTIAPDTPHSWIQ